MTSRSRPVWPFVVGALLLMVDQAKAAPNDDTGAAAAAAPDVPPASPPEEASPPAAEGPSLVLPDDTRDEGHEDPIAKIAELEARLDQMQSLVTGRQPRVIVGGYIDLGFFATEGNGSGIVRDEGHMLFPQYSNYGWLFYGDIL